MNYIKTFYLHGIDLSLTNLTCLLIISLLIYDIGHIIYTNTLLNLFKINAFDYPGRIITKTIQVLYVAITVTMSTFLVLHKKAPYKNIDLVNITIILGLTANYIFGIRHLYILFFYINVLVIECTLLIVNKYLVNGKGFILGSVVLTLFLSFTAFTAYSDYKNMLISSDNDKTFTLRSNSKETDENLALIMSTKNIYLFYDRHNNLIKAKFPKDILKVTSIIIDN